MPSVLHSKYSTVVNKYSTFNYGLRKQPSLMILTQLYGLLPLLKCTYKEIQYSKTSHLVCFLHKYIAL